MREGDRRGDRARDLGRELCGSGNGPGRTRQDGHQAIADLDAFLAAFDIGIVPLDEQQARIALKARIAFGKGFGTRGGLNFGDCFAYALAKSSSSALLFVGDDFAATDVEPALAR